MSQTSNLSDLAENSFVALTTAKFYLNVKKDKKSASYLMSSKKLSCFVLMNNYLLDYLGKKVNLFLTLEFYNRNEIFELHIVVF